jgi:hypothetical protein
MNQSDDDETPKEAAERSVREVMRKYGPALRKALRASRKDNTE